MICFGKVPKGKMERHWFLEVTSHLQSYKEVPRFPQYYIVYIKGVCGSLHWIFFAFQTFAERQIMTVLATELARLLQLVRCYTVWCYLTTYIVISWPWILDCLTLLKCSTTEADDILLIRNGTTEKKRTCFWLNEFFSYFEISFMFLQIQKLRRFIDIHFMCTFVMVSINFRSGLTKNMHLIWLSKPSVFCVCGFLYFLTFLYIQYMFWNVFA
jgi:hypothetical protein